LLESFILGSFLAFLIGSAFFTLCGSGKESIFEEIELQERDLEHKLSNYSIILIVIVIFGLSIFSNLNILLMSILLASIPLSIKYSYISLWYQVNHYNKYWRMQAFSQLLVFIILLLFKEIYEVNFYLISFNRIIVLTIITYPISKYSKAKKIAQKIEVIKNISPQYWLSQYDFWSGTINAFIVNKFIGAGLNYYLVAPYLNTLSQFYRQILSPIELERELNIRLKILMALIFLVISGVFIYNTNLYYIMMPNGLHYKRDWVYFNLIISIISLIISQSNYYYNKINNIEAWKNLIIYFALLFSLISMYKIFEYFIPDVKCYILYIGLSFLLIFPMSTVIAKKSYRCN
jgi:hypothetical protein